MQSSLTIKNISRLCLLVCIAVITAAGFVQFHFKIEPCVLCVLQRLVYLVLAILFLMPAISVPTITVRRYLFALITLVCLVGVGIAGRNVWLQHLPAGVAPPCGPGFNFLVATYPLFDALRFALQSTGDCAKVDWLLMGMSMAQWSLCCFIGLTVMSIWQMLRSGIE